ncbi:D-alanine-D-alanine ligase-like ATP-grasp enzyme [Evansella vedderi]|uniref:D-alanine-D-alanine ligase-like ATP-grasp enzyme n=1 Tax=Evansella vedderi TaxID=38282 RepID=A0ABT9ZVS8_9BACI|nr:YheC/YheD family protein [Evansella vedderi]MDQ0255319.1 D-alanine-D-alanine ligase-like ATP-grasp enzyme [Evansella vedderi]
MGQLTEEVYLDTHEEKNENIYVHEGLFNRLLLLDDKPLNIWKEDRRIRLGPVVAVFVNMWFIKKFERNTLSTFGENHMRAGDAAHCLTYFFSIKHINWKDKKIKGYIYDSDKKQWSSSWFPFPDVIYDRGASFRQEQKSVVKFIRQQFRKDASIKFLNHLDALGKWEVHRHLSKHSKMNRHLPETIQYSMFKDIKRMLNKHRFIFLKAVYGSRGEEIMSIEQKRKKYILIYNDGGLKRVKVKKLKKVKNYVKNFIDPKKRFIVQQGIPIMKYNDSHFDTRVLMIKDENGEWQAVYNHASVAKRNYSITTVNHQAKYYEDIYNDLIDEKNIPTDEEVRKFGVEVAELIDKEMGPFGEIGLDVTVDEEGHLWLLEANSKPDKLASPGIEYSDKVLPQYLSTIEYAKFLSKTKNSDQGADFQSPFKKMAQIISSVKNTKKKLVVGAFVSIGHMKKMLNQTPVFRHLELMKANDREHIDFYFFSIKDIDLINYRIKGVYFNQEKGVWKQTGFPFPDVLYDRGGGVLKNQKIVSDYIREQLEFSGKLKKINPVYTFNKWELHQKLLGQKEMSTYLPSTRLYKCPYDIKKMFKQNNELYLKKCESNNGKNIVKIKKEQNDRYTYSYINQQLVQKTVDSFSELLHDLQFILKKKEVIIQSAINVLKVNNRHVDMRATIQRNGKGEVEIVAYPVRIGCPNYPITSTRTGSQVCRFDEFFKNYMSYSKNDITRLRKEVEEFLLTSFKSIEKVYGVFGELGLDFALDQKGSLWFIECNAKPGNDSLYMSHKREIVKKAFLNPLEYAKYISNFDNGQKINI